MDTPLGQKIKAKICKKQPKVNFVVLVESIAWV